MGCRIFGNSYLWSRGSTHTSGIQTGTDIQHRKPLGKQTTFCRRPYMAHHWRKRNARPWRHIRTARLFIACKPCGNTHLRKRKAQRNVRAQISEKLPQGTCKLPAGRDRRTGHDKLHIRHDKQLERRYDSIPRPMEQHGLCPQRAAHVRTQRQQARFHSANGPHVRYGLGILVRVHFRSTRVLPYEKPQPHCNLQCVCKNKARLYCRRTVDSWKGAPLQHTAATPNSPNANANEIALRKGKNLQHHLQQDEKGIRREILWNNDRRSTFEQRHRRIIAPHTFPLCHSLRGNRMRTRDMLCRLLRTPQRFMRTSSKTHGSKNRLPRPSTRSGRNTLQRHKRNVRLLQEPWSDCTCHRQGRVVSHRRLSSNRWIRLYLH